MHVPLKYLVTLDFFLCFSYVYIKDVPVDIVVLISSVQLQLKACQQVADHGLQSVVENPVPQAGDVLSVRLQFNQHLMQASVHLVSLLRENFTIIPKAKNKKKKHVKRDITHWISHMSKCTCNLYTKKIFLIICI